MRDKYRITKVAKALIIQLIICSIGIICGFTWEIYDENARWDKLFYPGIKIANIDLSGKTKNDGKKQLKSELIDKLNDYKLDIKVANFVFVLDCSKLIKSFDIDTIIDEAFNTGKNMDFRSKYNIIKQGIIDNFNLYIVYDEEYLQKFILDIQNKVNKEPVNAAIEISSEGTIRIIDEVKGLKLKNKELEFQIKDMINKRCFENTVIDASTEEIPAAISADMLSLIDTKIASTSTGFASSLAERANNINLAAKAINGIILKPNEIFSFNEIVGESTKENGYMVAPVLQSVDYKSGVGGGICQVSSTLYNTVLKSGISPIERKNHNLPISYVELGLDATVYWNSIDFKFENTLDYPIYIESYTKNKELYVNFYSNSALKNKEYILKTDVYDIVPAKVQIIDDESLASDESIIVQKGSDGYWVMVIRNTYENGELIDSEIISDDYYESVDRIIRKGL